jgi:hypothetical protein
MDTCDKRGVRVANYLSLLKDKAILRKQARMQIDYSLEFITRQIG